MAKVLTEYEKKQYANDVGKILVKKYGKHKYYSPDRVKQASKETKWDVDWHCWAMCLYTSPEDFDRYHESIGEVCDYALMKGQMAYAITDGASDSWFDYNLSWLDWPDFDFPSVFDIFD